VDLQPFLKRVLQLSKPIVRYEDVQRLETAERARAEMLGMNEFRYATNEDMLRAIRLEQGIPHR
jgi:hypothetical protein